ncbi:hypothetical protein LXL04_025354 [Taraxacum kok-saghyz]
MVSSPPPSLTAMVRSLSNFTRNIKFTPSLFLFFNNQPLPSHTEKLFSSICHYPTTAALDNRLIVRPFCPKFLPTIQLFFRISGSETITSTHCICVIRIAISDLLTGQILSSSKTDLELELELADPWFWDLELELVRPNPKFLELELDLVGFVRNWSELELVPGGYQIPDFRIWNLNRSYQIPDFRIWNRNRLDQFQFRNRRFPPVPDPDPGTCKSCPPLNRPIYGASGKVEMQFCWFETILFEINHHRATLQSSLYRASTIKPRAKSTATELEEDSAKIRTVVAIGDRTSGGLDRLEEMDGE